MLILMRYIKSSLMLKRKEIKTLTGQNYRIPTRLKNNLNEPVNPSAWDVKPEKKGDDVFSSRRNCEQNIVSELKI